MDYIARHIGPDQHEQQELLHVLGYDSIDALIAAAVPSGILADGPLELPEALTEYEAQARLRELAGKNRVLRAFYGQGFNSTLTPPVIRRGVVEDAGWYTAYTPYQAEISQGRLEALLNFQTMVEDLTGLDIANASLLDAVGLMSRVVKKGRRVLLDARLHPQVIKVAAERARAIDLEVEVANLAEGVVGEDLVGAVFAYPGTEGDIADPRLVIEAIHDRGGLVAVDADILALTLLESPGELGADIAIGSTQRFGVPLFYGGPHAAYMAVRAKLQRQMPGRLVGVSKDAEGYPAYRLALQTREQHIRRERATSNICTAQALLAVTASMYAVYHGPEGLTAIARAAHQRAAGFAAALEQAGVKVKHTEFFDTVAVEVGDAPEVVAKLAQDGYLVRAIDATTVGVSFGEDTTDADVAALLSGFGAQPGAAGEARLPQALGRTTDFLTHETFNRIHSETQMMRYIRALGDKDLALDRTMIPLGSCTMKLNPTAGLEAITWPEFANVHPYTPDEYTEGWRELIDEIRSWLVAITGYAEVSVQPNSGATGELAGLLAIRGYHVANGETERDICLIPASAHGTNAASATLANLRVVVVKTAEDGSIDIADLDEKLAKHEGHVAAIMLTYPSTHGVYEADVRTVCDKVHAAGGQVYIDGANMNALTGIARPGDFGGDVSHLNLHKTFTIPHGGGGPGVGPIGVAEHLIPFLPGDPNAALDGDGAVPVASTRYGSAGVLPISWAYIAMSGAAGLRSATAHAVLNANYIARQLQDSFPVLYTGNEGLVGHECILDLRELTDQSGVTAADVAKRLIDYGFHAPTLAFPVAGTLMVEPTESEDLAELDRFIEAMRSIRAEIQDIIDGKIEYEKSVVHNAPYTAASVIRDEWPFEFTREQAAYPVASLERAKYFPPVRRIDEAFGDRNLQCACPPPEAFDITPEVVEETDVVVDEKNESY